MPPDPPRIEGPGGPSIITAAYFSRVSRLLQNILKPLCLPYMGSTWVTMAILRADLAIKDKKSFQPLQGQVSEGSRFIQTMTNPRVFLRVKVLLAVLQLQRRQRKEKQEIPSTMVVDLWLAEI